ncbi:hypothetical protein AA313_de0203381 [Arthrobotrys entomopaga]|nr:hypothetical protein AA313_de0203381 [Arthrobotrys entomopaga]
MAINGLCEHDNHARLTWCFFERFKLGGTNQKGQYSKRACTFEYLLKYVYACEPVPIYIFSDHMDVELEERERIVWGACNSIPPAICVTDVCIYQGEKLVP